MKKRQITILIILLILITAIFYGTKNSAQSLLKNSSKVQSIPSATMQPKAIELQINYGNLRPADKVITAYQNGETVLNLLKRSKTIETKTYSFGVSVENINGVKSGTDGKYWLFYVNGVQSTVGADKYTLSAGDKVEWRLEKGE